MADVRDTNPHSIIARRYNSKSGCSHKSKSVAEVKRELEAINKVQAVPVIARRIYHD